MAEGENHFLAEQGSLGVKWGLGLQQTIWIFNAIIVPMLNCAAFVWSEPTSLRIVRAMLDSVLALFVKNFYFVRRNRSSAAINALLDAATVLLAAAATLQRIMDVS